jgi:hypothetical protein
MSKYKDLLIISLTVCFIIAVFFGVNKTTFLEVENKRLKDSASVSKTKAEMYLRMYENLKQKDGVLIKRKDSLLKQKAIIKTKYVEKIKLVSKYSVSDMQCYFNERTGKSCDTRQYSVSKNNHATN